jgi:predicted double-glycine peptidase
MNKQTFITFMLIIAGAVIVYTAYIMTNELKKAAPKGEWIEKTINKESMENDADCGIVSVKMILGFYDMDISYEEIKTEINATTDGTRWKDIKTYLNTLDNVDAREFYGNIGKAKEYTEKGYPLFICWDVDKNPEWSHYSILISINKNSVWMLDPEEKKSLSEYSLDYFLPCWEKENYWFCILEVNDEKNRNKNPDKYGEITVNSEVNEIPVMQDSVDEYLSRADTNEIDWMMEGTPIKEAASLNK